MHVNNEIGTVLDRERVLFAKNMEIIILIRYNLLAKRIDLQIHANFIVASAQNSWT
jgi:hypothetical protein